MTERRKSAARKPVRKTAARRKSSTGKTSPKRWSQRVTRESDALDLKHGVFKQPSAAKIAASLKRSAQKKLTPQSRRLSLCALDADVLHQPRRQELAKNPARPSAT